VLGFANYRLIPCIVLSLRYITATPPRLSVYLIRIHDIELVSDLVHFEEISASKEEREPFIHSTRRSFKSHRQSFKPHLLRSYPLTYHAQLLSTLLNTVPFHQHRAQAFQLFVAHCSIVVSLSYASKHNSWFEIRTQVFSELSGVNLGGVRPSRVSVLHL
jgi:hypothetical protein